MKQESAKKSKKLLWLIIALAALLVVAGAVAAILLLPGGEQTVAPTGPVGGRPDLYWNVDRHLYLGNDESAGLSTREPAEDGLYHIRFAYNGELVEYTFADKRLVNVIDNQDVLGLAFDADGNPVDAIDPTTFAKEVAKSFFVVSNKNGTLTLNSSIVMNGMQMPIAMGELAQIYDVRTDAPNPGAIAEVEPMDKVVVYGNDKGETTHVYIVERQPEADIYWRVDKMYDSTNKVTTRVPDENGVYSLTFAKDGKQVELYCDNKELVTEIDMNGGNYNAAKGLRVDENGFIQEIVEPTVALRGKLLCSEYHVTEMNGTQITATCLLPGVNDQGKSVTADIPADCPIYNCCIGGSADMIGEVTELQMYDRVIIYTDLEGKPVLVFVMYRMANTPMYYNILPMYDSTTQKTIRVPDASGYYKFEMSVQGKTVTLKTKDKDMASEIDSISHGLCGLEVEGNIIKRVYNCHYVSGNDYYGAGGTRALVEQTGTIMSMVNAMDGWAWSVFNLVTSPNVEIYDVSGYAGTKIGEKTTVNVGDYFRIVADYNGNITHIYVLERYTGDPIYYNYIRMYDTVKAETTRVPNEEGYYVFEMTSRGKDYTGENALKTKDKAIANLIDKQLAPVVALDVKNGIIRSAAAAATSYKFGYKTSNYHWIRTMNEDNSYTTIISSGEGWTYKYAEDVKVYNVSEIYNKYRGEQIPISQLRPGDRIQGIATREDGLVREIYVMSRKVDSKLYYNIYRQYNTVTNTTTRVPNEEGYYVFDLQVDGQLKQFKTKDKKVATAVDYFNYVPFGMKVDGDIILLAFDATCVNGIKSIPASNMDVTKIDGKNVTVTRYLPTYSDVGYTTEMKLASNFKAYNVSAYAEDFGAEMKLGLGDRGIFYSNDDGEVVYAYIWYENTHEKGHISYCEHCGKKVYWQPYAGTTYSSNGADNVHLYVTGDRKLAQGNHGILDMPESDRTHVILDLNGKTLSPTSGRNFLIYGTMSIVDTVGGGKLLGSTDYGNANGGSIMIGKGGVLNIYSGTLTENPNNLSNSVGGVLYVGPGGTTNMYGGTIEGGTANTAGSNVYVLGEATFNMTGGTIEGGFAVTDKNAKINIGGKAVINANSEGGLILPDGIRLPLKNVTADTKVIVDVNGVFTEESDNIQNYLQNFTASAPEFAVQVSGKALAGGKLAYCEHCQKEVYWSRFSAKGATGHFIVVEDMKMDQQIQIGACPSHTNNPESCNHSTDMVVDLNGHIVTTDGNGEGGSTGRFALVYGKLSIMDSSAAKTGKIQTARKGTNNGGLLMVSVAGTLNLYGGELTMAEGAEAGKGGIIFQSYATFNMYGGKISGGKAVTSGGNLFLQYSAANIFGGVIENGKANPESGYNGGGNIYATGSQINVKNATVKNGETTRHGGNILAASTNVELGEGAIFEGGKAVIVGGNISKWNTGSLRILPGAFVGEGECNLGSAIYMDNSTKNTTADLYVAGIVEGITHLDSVGGDVAVTVSGDAKIENLRTAGYKINVEELTENADIKVNASGVITVANENAADFAQYFKPVNETMSVRANQNGELEIGIFAYCEHCQSEVAWTTFNPNVYSYSQDAHLIVMNDVTMPWQFEQKAGCTLVLNLNGKTITAPGRLALIYGDMYVVDTEATGKIISTGVGNRNGGIFQVGGGSLNIYGGELSLAEGASASARGGLIINYTTLNIYGGKFIGGKAIAAEGKNAEGGNIFIAKNAVLNMYGGEIIGGTGEAPEGYTVYGGNIASEDATSTINIYGGKISGGQAVTGGNIYSYGKLNITGGEITGGVAQDSGGNIGVYTGPATISNCKVTDGKAISGRGGNITGAGGCVLNIVGAEITGGQATGGGNINTNNGDIKISGNSVISGGVATTSGGNLYSFNVNAGRGIEIVDSTVTGGKAPVGGNMSQIGATGAYGKIVITDSTISGGKATTTADWQGGGNINAYLTNVTITGSRIEGGETTKCGGNIQVASANLILGEGTVVHGGAFSTTSTNQLGPNICKFDLGNLEIQAGATVSGNWVWMNNSKTETAKLIVAGDLNVYTEIGSGPVEISVSGAAKVQKLVMPASLKINVSEMAEGALVNIKAREGVFTNVIEPAGKAAEYAKYFKDADGKLDCGAVGEQLGFGKVAPCAHCGEGKSAVWTTFSATAATKTGHYRVTEATTIDSQLVIGASGNTNYPDVVIDLNGQQITVSDVVEDGTNKSGRFALVYGYLSILDNATGGKIVTTANSGRNGGLIMQTTGALNVYGGELTMADGIAITGNGGIVIAYAPVNIYGGKITNGNAVVGGNIFTTAALNIYGGEISGGEATNAGGNIYSTGVGTEISNAAITGGQAAMGGNIGLEGSATAYTKLTATNATITGGVATSTANYTGGGNIMAIKANVTLTGTRVAGGQAGTTGGNILASNANLVLANGTVVDGGAFTATSGTKLGPNICKFDSGNFEVQAGATISGNWVWMNNSTTTKATLTLAGNVNVYIELGAGPVETIVTGNVNVYRLAIPANYKITLGELTENASITIEKAGGGKTGVFTNESPKAAEYAKYFKPEGGIKVVGNTLSYE